MALQLVLSFSLSELFKFYLKRFVHLYYYSATCYTELLEIVSDSLQEDYSRILDVEIAVEDSITEVVLRRIF